MSSIISKNTLKKLQNLREYILKFAIWILVGAVIVGALTIMMGGLSSGEVILKFMGTLFIVALAMMVSVNNFRMIATEKPEIQSFALVGLVSNLCWGLLWTLLCWNPDWFMEPSIGYRYSSEMSLLAKFAFAFSYLSALGLFCSNIMNIYEGSKKSMIRPLKITAVVCIVYEMIYATIVTFVGANSNSELAGSLGMLAGFVGFCWFFIVIAALILSSNEKNQQNLKQTKNQQNTSTNTAKTDDELRAEIEEKVRREMIEKEVRAKYELKDKSQTESEEVIEQSFEVKE